jgi:hypothetical protein
MLIGLANAEREESAWKSTLAVLREHFLQLNFLNQIIKV